jgi:hypothetical protein
MTREQLVAILRGGDFGRFVGVEENLEVEFKGEPYHLDTDAGKFELAKDASALANASGGAIVMGVRTERHAVSLADVAAEIRAFDRALVDENRYLDVLADRVYPRIRGIRVTFFAAADDVDRGLVAIVVPPQDEESKYFLVQRPFGGEGRTPGWLVGIAIRSFDRVEEQRVGEIHSLVNRGLSIGRQLTDVAAGVSGLREAVFARGAANEQAVEGAADGLDAVVDERLRELGA